MRTVWSVMSAICTMIAMGVMYVEAPWVWYIVSFLPIGILLIAALSRDLTAERRR